MSPQDHLRRRIDEEYRLLRANVPPDRQAALLALLRTQALDSPSSPAGAVPDVISGNRLADPGGNKAIWLCFDSTVSGGHPSGMPSGAGSDGWARAFREACGRLAAAEVVLDHCQTGFMRLIDDAAGTFDAWVATKLPPPSWRERVDFDWWAVEQARRQGLTLDQVPVDRPYRGSPDPEPGSSHPQLAEMYVRALSHQFGYPVDAELDGIAAQTFHDVLRLLIGSALASRQRGDLAPVRSEREMVDTTTAALALDPVIVSRAIAAFTVDEANAGWHAAVPGVAAAPLVRIAPGRLALSIYGLTTEPLLFLTRELRRRSGQAYHDAAWQRESAFRTDLYGLFPDRRFVTGARRIELRRDGGDIRTDIDAVIFDRKTGTLGVFELKSQDPFARSIAERTRQRDNVLFANRQVSGVLDWLNRHGADDLLSRVDSRTAKTFRVQKVLPFVLGRYLAHFSDGPEPDRRAAWGTWPQVLRLFAEQPPIVTSANPLASLHARLDRDIAGQRVPSGLPTRSITLGSARLNVYPSHADYRQTDKNPRDAPLPAPER